MRRWVCSFPAVCNSDASDAFCHAMFRESDLQIVVMAMFGSEMTCASPWRCEECTDRSGG